MGSAYRITPTGSARLPCQRFDRDQGPGCTRTPRASPKRLGFRMVWRLLPPWSWKLRTGSRSSKPRTSRSVSSKVASRRRGAQLGLVVTEPVQQHGSRLTRTGRATGNAVVVEQFYDVTSGERQGRDAIRCHGAPASRCWSVPAERLVLSQGHRPAGRSSPARPPWATRRPGGCRPWWRRTAAGSGPAVRGFPRRPATTGATDGSGRRPGR